jgi:UDP-N-acetylmuramyl pentapeptide phosphotransferase/UDP-N-acetylglucosamine-1-phosphate transferase
MMDVVITLVFSIVMLVFMAFPAMKIVEFIEKRIDVPEKWHNPLLIGMVIFLSLLIGLFLKFA